MGCGASFVGKSAAYAPAPPSASEAGQSPAPPSQCLPLPVPSPPQDHPPALPEAQAPSPPVSVQLSALPYAATPGQLLPPHEGDGKDEVPHCPAETRDESGTCGQATPPGPIAEEFPMYVVRVRDVLKMTKLIPHQEMLKANLLVVYDGSLRLVLFLSHQWVAFRSPDPCFDQFRILIAALENMISGVVVVKSSLGVIVRGAGVKAMTAEVACSFQEADVWYDYFGVPQVIEEEQLMCNSVSSASADHRNAGPPDGMLAAIRSLPSYVQRSNFFVVLAPSVKHHDLGTECDFATWLRRAWCNLEVFCSGLKLQKQSQILIRGAKHIEFMDPLVANSYHVGEGNITVESDRAILAPIVANLVAKQIHKLERIDACMANMLRVFLPRLMDGLPAEVREDANDAPGSLDMFLQKYGFDFVEQLNQVGWSILHYAAIEGRQDLVRELVIVHHVPVDVKANEVAPRIYGGQGATPLIVAAATGSVTAAGIVGTLVELKADINASNSLKITPLSYALVQRNLPMVQALLHAGADISHRNVLLATPLHAAAAFFPEAIPSLLAQDGAQEVVATAYNVFCAGVVNAFALGNSPRSQVAEYLPLLLDARGDINGQSQQPFATGAAPSRPLMQYLKMFDEDRCPEDSDGAPPPLLSAIYCDNPSCAMALLEAGADPHTTWLGRSLCEHAQRCCRTGSAWQPLLDMGASVS